MTGSHSSYMFSFKKNKNQNQMAFLRAYNILHSHQQRRRDPGFPHPHQPLVVSPFSFLF